MLRFRTIASLPARLLRRALDAVLLATIFAFVLIFALQFTPSQWPLQNAWVAGVKRAGDLFLRWVGSWIRPDWPVDTGFSFIPLGMALLAWLGKIGIDGLFLKVPAAFPRAVGGPRKSAVMADISTRTPLDSHAAHSGRPSGTP